MTIVLTPAVAILSLALPVFLLLIRPKARTSLSLPPGPKRLPFIGNLLVMPKTYQWAKYAEWSKEYRSDIIYLDVLSNPMIVLNSLSSVQEILMRRSALSADKPQSTMIKLIGWDWNIGLLPYGAIWRARRRLFWQEFNPSNSFLHHPSQLKYARQFLKDLLDDPNQFARHCHYTPASSMIEVAFGCGVEPKDDPTIIIAEKALHHFNESAISGTYLVDSLPILQYLPTWVPGAAFLRYAKIAYQDAMDLLNIPFMQAKERMIRGEISPCVVTRAYARHGQPHPEDLENERIIKEVSSMAYAGGADTSPPPLINFVAAMTLFPNVQAKAQAELDRVLGHRLPTYKDQVHLPYTQAIMWEVLRWKPVLPLGTAHLLTNDDSYNGYFLPGGCTVLPNIWAIFRDETLFPDPDQFKPERFLNANGGINAKLTDVVGIGFGFGRRICPGRFFARDTVWLWTASMLTVFDIKKAKDDIGKEITPDVEILPLMVTKIKPFKCDIKPRSAGAEKLIREPEL